MQHRSEIRCRRAARLRAFGLFAVASAFAIGTSLPADETGRDGARVAVKPRGAPHRNAGRSDAIRLDINLVLVPVTVTDPVGAPVTGLPKKAFRLFENGVEQEVKYFTSDDVPVSFGIVFDASRSMDGKLDESRAAVSQFFRASMPDDEFFLVEFNDSPRVLSTFTRNTEDIEKCLLGIQPKNWTSLLDAIYMAIHEMKQARHQRKALLILSDGNDNNSRYTESEMRNIVREADVCIYSIGLTGSGLFKRHLRPLKRLSEETGGGLWEAEKLSDLPEAVAKIGRAIRSQYVLGFAPRDRRNDGLFRKIEVRLDRRPDSPPLRASWRGGYYAAGQP